MPVTCLNNANNNGSNAHNMPYYVDGITTVPDGDSTVRRISRCGTVTEAVVIAHGVIDAFLIGKHSAGVTAARLFAAYKLCGEIPIISRVDQNTLPVSRFNHLEYAMTRCCQLCGV
jgi:hypothetical protein